MEVHTNISNVDLEVSILECERRRRTRTKLLHDKVTNFSFSDMKEKSIYFLLLFSHFANKKRMTGLSHWQDSVSISCVLAEA